MRAIDRQAIDALGIPGPALMEAAGIALARACIDELGGAGDGKRVAVVCGTGNNGGDGFVAARHLANAGAHVTLLLTGELTDTKGDAASHARALPHLRGLELVILGPTGASLDLDARGPWDMIVDCLFGTGARTPLTGRYAAIVEQVNVAGARWRCPVVACDIPSGLDADTGKAEGAVVQATRTVTFALPKQGLLLYPGLDFVGRLTVADIGIPRELTDGLSTLLTTQDELRSLLPERGETRDANKGSFGTLLVIAGSAGMAGASALTAISSLRAGVGLVMLAVPESLLDTAAVLAPEAVLRALPETAARTHGGPGALDAALALAEKCDAVALGPGMSGNSDAVRFVQELVSRVSKPIVIDADGLNAIADTPEATRNRGPEHPTVLTPHPGEMGRLLGIKTNDVQADRVAAVRRAAERFGAIALLKGSRTLIAAPDGQMAINRRGSAALATAGSGDVLTGVIGALLAQKLSAFDAARVGAYLHALAGEDQAQIMGTTGVLAGDVRDGLPLARRRIYGPMDLDEK